MNKLQIIQDIQLINPNESDLPFYQEWDQDDYGMFMFGNYYPLSNEDLIKDYIESVWSRSKIIKYKDTNIGFIKNTPDIKNRNCNIAVYISPKYRDKGLVTVAMYKYLTIIFDIDSYHKVEFSAYEYNKNSLNNFKLFHLDGIIREDKWYQGKYWDRHIYSLLVSEWQDIKNIYEQRIEKLNNYYIRK